MVKPKINTMKELSGAIGISRPTLSRYFQDPSSVLPGTAKKIETRLAEVDYVYNFIATRQNREKSGLLGVVVPHFNDLFFTSLLESIDKYARKEGVTVITQSSHGDLEQEIKAVGKLRSMGVDGALIAPLGAQSSTDAFQRASKDFPIVFMDSQPGGAIGVADFVGTDNVQSIGAIVEYLCRIGESPVFLGMPHLNSNALEREAAYKNAMMSFGCDPVLIDHCDFSETWDFEALGFSIMDHHFSRKRHINDAILCANDRIAIGAIRAANRHGLFSRGPDARGSLKIAGHDDHPLSQFMYPALTTMTQDVDAIGQSAVRLVLERAYHGKTGDFEVHLQPASLCLRESA